MATRLGDNGSNGVLGESPVRVVTSVFADQGAVNIRDHLIFGRSGLTQAATTPK